MKSTVRRGDLHEQMTVRCASVGIGKGARTPRRETALSDLASELTTAVDGAYWAYMLQAELEDAFDTALLRAAMSETPILAGALPAWS
jgi:hypothetical protein